MPKERSHKRMKAPQERRENTTAARRPWVTFQGWRGIAALCVLAMLCFWGPLTDPEAGIQWDAVDVHYSAQKYFSDHLRQGQLPYWTPYIFSGFPFLADPQVGAWYPLNWPFFLAGVTPRTIHLELALHALLATTGAYLLILSLLPQAPPAALTGALVYGLGGFFAGHSSHLGMYSAAALFPWLLFAFHRALTADRLKWNALAAAVGGFVLLAGHFQTALYAYCGLLLFATALCLCGEGSWKKAAATLALTVGPAILMAMVSALPAWELTQHSLRARADYAASREGTLSFASLATLLVPDALGARSGDYRGPGDITQYYFYAGVLLAPLAAFGLRRRRVLIPALALLVPTLWYMLGPAGGLYSVLGILPGFRQVRAPVHAWFVAALALAMLTAAGAEALQQRTRRVWLSAALATFFYFDIAYHNWWENRLVHAPSSFETLYGRNLTRLQDTVMPLLKPLWRFDAPDGLTALGPLNGPLDLRMETTYGYNPLQLSAYADYRSAMAQNEALRAGLNAAVRLDAATGQLAAQPDALPRVCFPKRVRSVRNPDEARAALATLDPRKESVVVGEFEPKGHDPDGEVEVLESGEDYYRIRYRAAGTSLLRFAVPYYPGWKAQLEGQPLTVLPVDHAFTGVVAPAGTHEFEFRYRPTRLAAGAALSFVGWLAVAAMATSHFWRRKRSGLDSPPAPAD